MLSLKKRFESVLDSLAKNWLRRRQLRILAQCKKRLLATGASIVDQNENEMMDSYEFLINTSDDRRVLVVGSYRSEVPEYSIEVASFTNTCADAKKLTWRGYY